MGPVRRFEMDPLAQRVARRFIAQQGAKRAMEHPSEEAKKKYLKDHPLADPADHSVKKEGPSGGAGAQEVSKTIDHNLKGLSLSKPTFDALKKFKKDIEGGAATHKDVKDLEEDLGFDAGQLHGKNDPESKKKLKQINTMLTFLKSEGVKKHLK
jgi:hypothetical protein